MNRKCLTCKRIIRESDRRDVHLFGSWSEPCQVQPGRGCRWCAPGDGDEDVDAMARDAADEARLDAMREGLPDPPRAKGAK